MLMVGQNHRWELVRALHLDMVVDHYLLRRTCIRAILPISRSGRKITGKRERDKADGNVTMRAARHTALDSQAQRGRLSHLQFHVSYVFRAIFPPDSYCILGCKTGRRNSILPGRVTRFQVGPRRDMLTLEIIKAGLGVREISFHPASSISTAFLRPVVSCGGRRGNSGNESLHRMTFSSTTVTDRTYNRNIRARAI